MHKQFLPYRLRTMVFFAELDGEVLEVPPEIFDIDFGLVDGVFFLFFSCFLGGLVVFFVFVLCWFGSRWVCRCVMLLSWWCVV